jgi:hypothetical protein
MFKFFQKKISSIFDKLTKDRVFRLNLSDNDPPMKVKVFEKHPDGLTVVNESGGKVFVPYSAVTSFCDITNDPGFQWKGK